MLETMSPSAVGDDTAGRQNRLRRWIQRLRAMAGRVRSAVATYARSPVLLLGRTWWQRAARSTLLVVNGIGLYFLVGMLALDRIDNDPAFTPAAPVEGGLRSVDVAAALIEREVNTHEWVGNAPFFSPAILLDNMAAFQEGILYALGRFSTEMADHMGRARGSSQVDPDLDRANGLLRFPGDVWVFELDKSLAPMVTSEEQYRAARDALLAYNRRVAAGGATFDPRVDNLLIMLERITADIGSQSALIEGFMRNGSRNPLDTRIDRIFHETKGRLYAYYLLLAALAQDFDGVIRQRDAGVVWQQMLGGFREAAGHVPFMVLNGEPGSLFFPSHLAEQGFFLLRAKTQLLDVVAVLRAN